MMRTYVFPALSRNRPVIPGMAITSASLPGASTPRSVRPKSSAATLVATCTVRIELKPAFVFTTSGTPKRASPTRFAGNPAAGVQSFSSTPPHCGSAYNGRRPDSKPPRRSNRSSGIPPRGAGTCLRPAKTHMVEIRLADPEQKRRQQFFRRQITDGAIVLLAFGV